MNMTIILVVGIYFLVSLSIGFWVARKGKNRTDEYFLAGRLGCTVCDFPVRARLNFLQFICIGGVGS